MKEILEKMVIKAAEGISINGVDIDLYIVDYNILVIYDATKLPLLVNNQLDAQVVLLDKNEDLAINILYILNSIFN